MALLVGRYVNKIDKKGRVSVPKAFREVFKEEGFGGLFAFPSLKAPAIRACGMEFMARLGASLENLEMFSDDQEDLASVIHDNAHSLSFDPEGRIVLPAELVDFAGITTQALFVGRSFEVFIWAPQTFEEHRKRTFERARSRGPTLPLRPRPPADGAP